MLGGGGGGGGISQSSDSHYGFIFARNEKGVLGT